MLSLATCYSLKIIGVTVLRVYIVMKKTFTYTATYQDLYAQSVYNNNDGIDWHTESTNNLQL